ncbi:MAG: DUF523 domain-containing protein [Myxococcaceae bacterium]|nr:DUF523 domain-containing protein [Myxococcaceae bacterium]
MADDVTDPRGRLERLRLVALRWPAPTGAQPWPVLFSGCLAGLKCGVDATDYGPHPLMERLCALPSVRVVRFCPEDAALGTPRGTPDLSGGDGRAVLDGRARVVMDDGRDVTAPLLTAAHQMVELARREQVCFAVLMDMSALCGTQVVSDGPRLVKERKYQRGLGVAAAALDRAGIPVVAQRDRFTLDALLEVLDPHGPRLIDDVLDHHERDWYRQEFG